MTYRKIQALMLVPGKYPTPVTLSTSKYSIRKAVNIGINHQYKARCERIDGDVCVLFNSDQLFSPLTPNRTVEGVILSGVIYIVAVTSENKLRSLTFEETFKYIEKFWIPEEYTAEEATSLNLKYLLHDPQKKIPNRLVNLEYRPESVTESENEIPTKPTK